MTEKNDQIQEKAQKTAPEAEKKSINEKISDLNSAVEWFYGDDFTLEDAAKRYKSTLSLAKSIEKDLDNLKNEIERISEDFSKE